MVLKPLWTAILVFLVSSTVLAQDPIKVEPKHYKLDFENERVQVVHIHYGPHETSSLHEHPAGVVVNVTAGHLRFTDQDGTVHEVYAKPGEARWFPAFKHQVENLSDKTYEGVYIAVKSKSEASLREEKPAPDPSSKIELAAVRQRQSLPPDTGTSSQRRQLKK